MNAGGSGGLEAGQRDRPNGARKLWYLLQRRRRIITVSRIVRILALRRKEVVHLAEVQVGVLAVEAAQVLLRGNVAPG